MEVANNLRNKGYKVESDLEDRSLKGQLRNANRLEADKVVIIGDDELSDGTVQIKDFSTGDQEEVDSRLFLKNLKPRKDI